MRFILTALAGAALLSNSVQAAPVTFNLFATGAQETGAGDPDGLATGPITLDAVTGDVFWNFTYSNIASPTAMHIHAGAAGVSSGVVIGLGTAGTPGNLMGALIAAPATVASIVAAPESFYVNIHNSEFSSGAIRGQVSGVPEPSSLLALCVATSAVAARRRLRS